MSDRKSWFVERRRGLPERDQSVADPLDVDLLDRVDQAEEIDPLLLVELADEPEVEEDDLFLLGIGEDVPGMRVAVEEAVDEDLLDDRPDEGAAELLRVEPGIAQLVGLRDLDALHELHRHDPDARQVVVDDGDMDGRELRHAIRQATRLVCLVPVVELLEDARCEFGDHRARADLSGHVQTAFGDFRQLLDHPEIRLGLGEDPRTLDLHGHDRSIVESRSVDLGGRCGGERLVFERRIQLLDRPSELGLDHPPGVVPAERSGIVLELRELADPLLGQEIGSAGRHLPDLHVRRAELLEQKPDALGAGHTEHRFGLGEDPHGEPPADAADGGLLERDVEARRVDRLVHLLEAQVLDDHVPARGRQRFEQSPHGVAVGAERRPVQPEDRFDERREEGVQRRRDEHPDDERFRDGGDTDRTDHGRDPDRQRVDPDDPDAHRREEESSGEGDDHRPGEPVHENEDTAPHEESGDAGPAKRDDRRRFGPEGKRLGDREEAEDEDDGGRDERVDQRLDKETAHLLSP